MCAWKEARMIVPAIRQFDNVIDDLKIDEIIVACSSKPWNGEGDPDNTAELAAKAGATVRLHDWKDEKDQKNWIMDKFKDKDWVLMFAPDMYMTTESLNNLLYYLKSADNRAYACDMVTYWKDFDHIVAPVTKFNSVAIRNNERFKYSSQIDNVENFDGIPGVLMHHLSYVRTPEEMETKIKTWSHAPEISKDWYSKWLNWKEGDTNLGMVNEKDVQKVIKYPLPEEIRSLICKYSTV